jgi:hypothetical protein
MRTPGDNGEINLATCELCFTHASTEEIAACELDPTIPAQEEASNQTFNAAHNLHSQTLIAYALRQVNPSPAVRKNCCQAPKRPVNLAIRPLTVTKHTVYHQKINSADLSYEFYPTR